MYTLHILINTVCKFTAAILISMNKSVVIFQAYTTVSFYTTFSSVVMKYIMNLLFCESKFSSCALNPVALMRCSAADVGQRLHHLREA